LILVQTEEAPRKSALQPARTEAPRVAFTEAGVALFHLLRQLETALPRLSPLPVSNGRMALLRSLALRGPRNLSELARERGVSRQGVQRLADALEAEGLARGAPDPRSARAKRLALTEQGLAAYRELALQEARELNTLAAGLSASDLRAATRVLRLLATRGRS
jgi:DNA-binding MarR family transcriptional regulator